MDMQIAEGRNTACSRSWGEEFSLSMKLAWPLIIAQLAQMSLFTTDVVMMGWLGPDYLAAGTLATSYMHPFFLFCFGILFAVSPLVAHAIGANDATEVRRATRQGIWIAAMLSLAMLPVMWNIQPIMLLLGQKPESAALAETYMRYAMWLFFPGLVFQVLRTLVAAHGDTMVVLYILIIGVVVNALSNYALLFGNWGFPRMELSGSGLSTTIANFLMCGLLMVYVLRHHQYKRYHLLQNLWHPDWVKLREVLRVGFPIGLMLAAEVGMFAVVTVMMGWLGTDELAAHAVALQCAAIAFMVPLGLSQGTTIRIGVAYGQKNREAIGRAGWVSFVMTLGYMSCTCMLFLAIPHALVGLFLDPALAVSRHAHELAVTYLWVAALFQLADGTQVVAASSLRGLQDTRIPMITAIFGYWLVGMPIAYYCGFTLGLRGQGIWFGLAAGLLVVAVLLTLRFALRERLGLIRSIS